MKAVGNGEGVRLRGSRKRNEGEGKEERGGKKEVS